MKDYYRLSFRTMRVIDEATRFLDRMACTAPKGSDTQKLYRMLSGVQSSINMEVDAQEVADNAGKDALVNHCAAAFVLSVHDMLQARSEPANAFRALQDSMNAWGDLLEAADTICPGLVESAVTLHAWITGDELYSAVVAGWWIIAWMTTNAGIEINGVTDWDAVVSRFELAYQTLQVQVAIP